MKRLFLPAVIAASLLTAASASAERVVILHTNDTHSQIDPDQSNRGGVVRRKAAIDSVRAAEPLTLLVDAGDAVQGSLYFTLFKGDTEQMVLNELGYDIQILGNHEFDNGTPALASELAKARPTVVSSNYDVKGSPLRDLIVPFAVKQVGNRRIGFLGININPDGIISSRNTGGIHYHDALEAANRSAAYLRNNCQVDAVVAVSHIGYKIDPNSNQWSDPALAARSRGIDVIIGGHSHSDLRPGQPETTVMNADSLPVLIVQNKNGGRDLGEVILDFGPDGLESTDWTKIAIGPWLDGRADPKFESSLAPYRHAVDSITSIKVGRLDGEFAPAAMLNFAADFAQRRGAQLTPNKKPVMAIVNKGGIRRNFAGPDLTVDQVITAFPFDNRYVVMDIKGSDLLEVFDIMARQGGNGVSSSARAVIAPDLSGCTEATINGRSINPAATYRIVTLDYLAGGGDNMTPLRNGRIVAESSDIIYNDMLRWLGSRRQPLVADPTPRMTPAR